ncbi:MAG: hypothetical protein Q8M31_12065 [Beijerinckiaceae bacterium]|nr:hypothetical protein [Beijerinckiaceae bacterium]
MDGHFTCAITGCQQPALRMPDGSDGFCEEHMAMAPAIHRQRFLTVTRRLQSLREIWNNEARYDGIVGDGRYLKLAHATCCAEEALDKAAQRLTLAILASQANPAVVPRENVRQRA